MKTEAQIKTRIEVLYARLDNEKAMYRGMTQIDMQGGEGITTQKYINKTRGEIKSLEWVLEL